MSFDKVNFKFGTDHHKCLEFLKKIYLSISNRSVVTKFQNLEQQSNEERVES